MHDTKTPQRRALLKAAGALALAGALPRTLLAAEQPTEQHFDPRPGDWKSYEVTTRVDLQRASGPSTVWVPLPVVDTDWQRTLSNNWSGNASKMRVGSDPRYGAHFLVAEFDGSAPPHLEWCRACRPADRAVDWKARDRTPRCRGPARLAGADRADHHRRHRQEGRDCRSCSGARSDDEKVQRIYDWVVVSTYREPKVRGCGIGDIKTMLETGNFGGKCADINALFVGLCRAAGVPARDIYGIRLVPSAFGYRELGRQPGQPEGRAALPRRGLPEGHGWVAMDPADVTKVMRQETPEWIKDAGNPLVAPVRKALFGGWEGNWMGYNSRQRRALPGCAQGAKLGFLMYPQAETAARPYDPLRSRSLRVPISARAIGA